MHADEAVYPDPERFDPDRMVGASLSRRRGLPFGGGARRCLGRYLRDGRDASGAAKVLRRTELATTTAAGERQRVKHVILIPDRGGRIRVNRLRVPSDSAQAFRGREFTAGVQGQTG